MDNEDIILILGLIQKMKAGGVTAAAVLAALENMSEEQAAAALEAIGGAPESALDGYEPKATVTEVTGAAPTIRAAANTVYNCGTLTSLTVDTFPQTGAWSIVFTSGSTATTTSFPANILGLDSFAAEANTMYEINVLDGRAVVGSWAVSAS